MKILIMGSGKVAQHMARAFCGAKQHQVMMAARRTSVLENLSKELGFNCYEMGSELPSVDFIMIATNDTSIAEVSSQIKDPKVLVVHTSGSMGLNELEIPNPKAVFYPLQTFSNQQTLNYKRIPIFIESHNDTVFAFLKKIATPIFGEISAMDFETRKALHLSAVFACNFVNHLLTIANEIANEHEIPFEILKPLIAETFHKIEQNSPKEMQTGPALRNDLRILELHEKLIKNEAFLKVYQSINQSIKKYYEL